MEFHLKTGDTSPSLRCFLLDGEGAAVPLTGATVVFSMFTQKAVAVITRRAVTITDAPAGAVRFDWQSGDTAASGTFNSEFEVTYAGGSVETFPNDGYLMVRIGKSLA